MTDLHQEIADLEAEIDTLSDAAEQCRKSMIVAKIAIGGGVVLLAGLLLGLIGSAPVALPMGIAAVLAGIGLYGSSRGTLEQTSATIRSCEERRIAIIDELQLRAVQGQ